MVKELKKWSDFEVGKKYRTRGFVDNHFATCVGFKTTGLPILENSSEQIYPASSYGYGACVENWSEYTEPRELWVVTHPDCVYGLAYYDEAHAEDAVARGWRGVIHVKEVT